MKNLTGATLLSLMALTLVSAPSAWAAERMKSGQWEMTSEYVGKPRVSTQCVTPNDVKAVNGTPAELRAYIEKTTNAATCKVQNFKMEGDTVSYTSTCSEASSDSTTTYHGDSFEMVITSRAGGKEQIRHMKARRLGACP